MADAARCCLSGRGKLGGRETGTGQIETTRYCYPLPACSFSPPPRLAPLLPDLASTHHIHSYIWALLVLPPSLTLLHLVYLNRQNTRCGPQTSSIGLSGGLDRCAYSHHHPSALPSQPLNWISVGWDPGTQGFGFSSQNLRPIKQYKP